MKKYTNVSSITTKIMDRENGTVNKTKSRTRDD